MAHEVETMAYVGETPWHGLGVNVEDGISPDDMLKAAGLDWRVEKIPTYYRDTHGNEILTGDSILRRSTDYMTYGQVPTDSWEPCQNHEAMNFFADFCEAGTLKLETAGSLRNGQFVWVLARTTEAFELFKGDVTQQYFLFSNPHKYGESISIGENAVRVVCANTLSLAMRKGTDMFRVSHRNTFNAEKVKEIMGLSKKRFDNYKEAVEFLGSKRYDNETVNQFFAKVFPVIKNNDNTPGRKEVSKNHRLTAAVLDSQPGTEYATGTWWQALNAVTYVTDHLMAREQDTRVYNIWYGTTKDLKNNALNKALEFAKAA